MLRAYEGRIAIALLLDPGNSQITPEQVPGVIHLHKAMSYRRMHEDEARLKEEARRLLAEAEQIDREEDKRSGRSSRGDELPAELQRRERRLERIAEAKRALELRARAEAEEKKDARPEEAKPEAKAQHNFTDPESRIMKGSDSFVQAYNAQTAVEPAL